MTCVRMRLDYVLKIWQPLYCTTVNITIMMSHTITKNTFVVYGDIDNLANLV